MRPNFSDQSEVDHRQQVADGEHRGAGGGEDVQHLELRRVGVIAARHADVAEQELREEGQVEADEDQQRRQARPPLGIHPAGDLRPPVVQAGHVGHDRAADHDVVEVGDDEVGVVTWTSRPSAPRKRPVTPPMVKRPMKPRT